MEKIEHILNITVHSSTKAVPYALEGIQRCTLPNDLHAIPAIMLPLHKQIDIAHKNLVQASERRNKQHAAKKKPTSYKVGDYVLKRVHVLSSKAKKISKKLSLIYNGPYIVSKIIRENAYELKNGQGKTIGIFNARQLRPFKRSQPKQQ